MYDIIGIEGTFSRKNKIWVMAVGASEIAPAKEKDRGDMPGPVKKGYRQKTTYRNSPVHFSDRRPCPIPEFSPFASVPG